MYVGESMTEKPSSSSSHLWRDLNEGGTGTSGEGP